MKLVFLIIIVAGFWYAWVHDLSYIHKIKVYFGAGYQEVELHNLFSVANLYNGKNICTTGYYIETEGITILKQTFDSDFYNKSIWTVNNSGRKILVDASAGNKGALSKLCGKFESGRGSGFGQPSIWNHQLTIADFELLERINVLPR